MNRYLFRGKCPHTGKWYVGYLMTSRDGYYNPYKMCIMHDKGTGERDPWRILPIDPDTIGQSTGLLASKSCRGDGEAERLIFEGDICAVHTGHKGIGTDFGTKNYFVRWRSAGAYFDLIPCEHPEDRIGYTFDNGGVWSVEIIGNIHDHTVEEKS